MEQPEHRSESATPEQVEALAQKVNETLLRYADKGWNYSRISLMSKILLQVDSPYVLWYELLPTTTKAGRIALKAVADEINWGERHSNELGILEIVSLRLNKALLECTSDEFWRFNRPVFRLEKKEALAQKGVIAAFWYEVHETKGEDFENR
jgi:hypothetical protein